MVCTDADRSSKLKRICENSRRDFLVSHLGVIVSEVARRHDITPQHLFGWRKAARTGRLVLPAAEPPMFVPIVTATGEQARLGPLPAFVTGGPQNPMGARGLYLYLGGKDTQYRIHGTNQPEHIGRAISSGCEYQRGRVAPKRQLYGQPSSVRLKLE